MLDLIFVAVIVAFFAVCVAYVRGCARIIGRDAKVANAPVGDASRASRGEATAEGQS